MTPFKLNLEVKQGATFSVAVNWYGGGKVCHEIEALTPGCPTTITITDHGLPSVSSTPVFIQGVRGASAANTSDDSPVMATYVDDDTFTIDADTYGRTYTSGTGVLIYYAPQTVAGYSARMHIRTTVDADDTIHEMVSPTDITINTADAKITLTISATDTAAFTFDNAVYDLEMVDGSGNVTRLMEGEVTLSKEVTR